MTPEQEYGARSATSSQGTRRGASRGSAIALGALGLVLCAVMVMALGRDAVQQPQPLAAVTSAVAEPTAPPSPPPAPVSAAAVNEMAESLPRLHSLLVSRNGEILFERYYNGIRPTRLANIKSASKSVISALVGIAIARGHIPSVKEPIVTYFPELLKDPEPRKREITVENLLEMRSGLEGTSNRNYGAWVTSRNWVRHALSRPMFADPDEEMEYSTGNTHLLSAILTKATGKSTWEFANEVLARPLGFQLARWPRDPQGIYFGGNDMLMTPRQLLAFGELYLNRGRYNGEQIVPEAWVERSCQGRPRRFRRGGGPPQFNPDGFVDPSRDREYGYGWWVRDFAGQNTCFAWGYGGQYVFVVPSLDLVIVTTSDAGVSEERRGHRRSIFEIVEGMIIAPLAQGAFVTS